MPHLKRHDHYWILKALEMGCQKLLVTIDTINWQFILKFNAPQHTAIGKLNLGQAGSFAYGSDSC